MAPMKVYGSAVSPWMARALVCLEEAGAEYVIVPMSRCGGDHRRPEHLARNVRTYIDLQPRLGIIGIATRVVARIMRL
jgi:hypothetical protein